MKRKPIQSQRKSNLRSTNNPSNNLIIPNDFHIHTDCFVRLVRKKYNAPILFSFTIFSNIKGEYLSASRVSHDTPVYLSTLIKKQIEEQLNTVNAVFISDGLIMNSSHSPNWYKDLYSDFLSTSREIVSSVPSGDYQVLSNLAILDDSQSFNTMAFFCFGFKNDATAFLNLSIDYLLKSIPVSH